MLILLPAMLPRRSSSLAGRAPRRASRGVLPARAWPPRCGTGRTRYRRTTAQGSGSSAGRQALRIQRRMKIETRAFRVWTLKKVTLVLLFDASKVKNKRNVN